MGMTCLLTRDYDRLPKEELHRSLQVGFACLLRSSPDESAFACSHGGVGRMTVKSVRYMIFIGARSVRFCTCMQYICIDLRVYIYISIQIYMYVYIYI